MTTVKQRSFIERLARERGIPLDVDLDGLDAKNASRVIDALLAVPVPKDEAVAADEAAKIAALEAALPGLPLRDMEFAVSLVKQYRERGSLSERQWPHVERLAAPKSTSPSVTVAPGDIVALDEGTFAIVVSGKNGGTYAKLLTTEGLAYVKGLIYRCRKGEVLTGDRKVEIAARFGIAAQQCVFCGRHLATSESLTAGYGPDCAAKYGLPWG